MSIFKRIFGKRDARQIEIAEFNRAIEHVFYILVSEGLADLHRDLQAMEGVFSMVWQVEEGENRDAARYARADYAAYLLSELELKYYALMDREREIDIDRREVYIYSLIENEFGYERE